MPSPSPGVYIGGGTDVYLNATDGVATDDLWAAGTYKTQHSGDGFLGFQTFAIHWDGDDWTQVETPETAAGGTGADIRDLHAVASDSVWASGYRIEIAPGVQTVANVLHWDGNDWTELPIPPLRSNQNHNFQAIHVFAEDDIWAAGGHSDPDGGDATPNPYVGHWDGSSWTIYDDVPEPGVLNYVYDMVAVAPDDIWLVGQMLEFDPSTGLTQTQPYIVHWDGGSWELVDLPGFDRPFGSLRGVTAVAPDDIWAVGTYTASAPPSPSRKLILHWDGRAWTQEPEDPAGPIDGTLWDTTPIPGSGKAWAVGQDAATPNPTERLCPKLANIFYENFESGTVGRFGTPIVE